jgi:hypothetical protein
LIATRTRREFRRNPEGDPVLTITLPDGKTVHLAASGSSFSKLISLAIKYGPQIAALVSSLIADLNSAPKPGLEPPK